jgi:hypothetical protein
MGLALGALHHYPTDRLKRLYENGGLAEGDGLVPPPSAAPFWPVSDADQEAP